MPETQRPAEYMKPYGTSTKRLLLSCALLALLPTLQGKFVLSSYPSPALTQAIQAHGWHHLQWDVVRPAGNGRNGRGARKVECLTANFPLTPQPQLQLNA